MKNIFKEAHKMTREMVEKYGVDYQAQFGLNLSYLLENKGEEEMKFIKKEEVRRDFEDGLITLTTSNRQPAWIAEIVGLDSQYGFKREFINEPVINGGRWVQYQLKDNGIYNWREGRRQLFGLMENGKLFEISKVDAERLLNK